MQGCHQTRSQGYEPPQIVDLGGLREITEAHDLFFGSATSHTNMAMSNPVGGMHTTTVGGVNTTTPGGSGTSTAGLGASGGTPSSSAGGVSGATGGGGGGGAQGELPFTGYNVSMVAAIGSALSAAGAAIRHRLTRQHR